MTTIDDAELVVVTGKGGTGRTTVATALGLAAAARG
jgi:anion-transporting  ArsA/GET3 family ATPase